MEMHGKNPKIDPAGYNPIQDRGPDSQTDAGRGRREGSSDVVALSPTARKRRAAGKALKNLPEARLEKVTRLREQIEKGAHSIDRIQIADKRLRESLRNDRMK